MNGDGRSEEQDIGDSPTPYTSVFEASPTNTSASQLTGQRAELDQKASIIMRAPHLYQTLSLINKLSHNS